MLSSLTAGQFAKRFALATLLIASGTVFFGQLLAILVPSLAVGVCDGTGACNAIGAFLGIRFKPFVLLAGAIVAVYAFARRGRALGAPLWALFPLALMVPNFPALFMLGREWGADYGIGLMFFPRWSFYELLPLLVAGLLFASPFEHAPGYAGSFLATRLFGVLPVGALYVASCFWVGGDLIVAALGVLGLPPATLAELQWALHYPLAVTDGSLALGLPVDAARPDFMISLAAVANLTALALFVLTLRIDRSGRRARALPLAVIAPVEVNGDARPLFRRDGNGRA